MRQPDVIEAELAEISGIAEDENKFERIVAWCATHPDEIPFAFRLLMGRAKPRPETARPSHD
ncbi:MAG: hypothetical protein M3N54_15790 [Acidobacteriota bacterium]|nr:hypothetical protein [Acidobacteriota bacterium]